MRGLILSVLAALFAATPASAQWGSTRWGMTLDQVLETVPGARALAREGTGSDVWKQHRLAAAPWRDGDIELIADFFFDPDNHTLTLVKVQPVDVGQCKRLGEMLIARYGAGARDERSFDDLNAIALAIRWVDPKTRERLLYSTMNVTGQPPRYCHFIQQVPA